MGTILELMIKAKLALNAMKLGLACPMRLQNSREKAPPCLLHRSLLASSDAISFWEDMPGVDFLLLAASS